MNPAWVRPTLWTPTHQEYSFVKPHDLAEATAKTYNIGNDEKYRSTAVDSHNTRHRERTKAMR